MLQTELPPDDEQYLSKSTLRVGHLIVIAAVAILIAGLVYYMRGRGPGEAPRGGEGVTEVPEGSRAVTLYFADSENEALVTETRLVAIGKEFADQISQVVRALLSGPQENGVSTIAAGTRILGVFYDSESRTLYLDFTGEIIAGHPGGSSAEYFTIAAIVRTISENFPEVQAVQILVEGFQVGTLAGHIDAYRPFLVSDWR